MSQEIYKLWMIRPKEAFYQLSEEERQDVQERAQSALAEVGGEYIVICSSAWCSEQWTIWGVERFPSVEAVMQHARILEDMDELRYFDSMTLLGTPGAGQPSA